ncbi:hypothetical protein GYB59_06130 [bacterium]|nr:hypothetical protein [bacterium]
MTLSEMSFLKEVRSDALCTFLSCVFAIDRSFIGTKSDYWERFGSDTPLLIGIEIEWSESGYQTFLKWVQPSELSGPELLTIAIKAAAQFATDVAIGDVFVSEEQMPSRHLVCKHPEGVFRAIETSNGNVFDLHVEPSPIPHIQIKHFLDGSDT